jgi:DNA-binding response OmpR family regulator
VKHPGRDSFNRFHLDFIRLCYNLSCHWEVLMRVLVVEDERKISAYVKRGLEEQGYAVDAVYTGQEALDWAEAAPYDLIVLDILLPQMDGLSVCRELRRRGLRTPVLMLTARDTVDDRVNGLDAGADDYLVKPFALKELLARLRALARRIDDVPKSTLLQLADLSLDTLTRCVRRGDKAIELTNKEYAVLECLLREPERILTRTQIAEHVWNYDVYNQSNVVDVYIRNLRRKIDDGFNLKLIHTIRGAGYRLSAEGGDETA